MKKETTLVQSKISNTYGGLDLVEFEGVKYLRMGDCYGPDYFGPLTSEQIAAFGILTTVEEFDLWKLRHDKPFEKS